MDDAMDCLISFTDFLFAFQAQFYYEEFLSGCADVYKSLQEDPHISLDQPVVVPTLDTLASNDHGADTPTRDERTGSEAYVVGSESDQIVDERALEEHQPEEKVEER